MLMLVSITGYTQKRELPVEVKSAFETKYQEARLGSWWELSELYYFDSVRVNLGLFQHGWRLPKPSQKWKSRPS